MLSIHKGLVKQMSNVILQEKEILRTEGGGGGGRERKGVGGGGGGGPGGDRMKKVSEV